MIPYPEIPPLAVGPLRFPVASLLIAAAVLTGHFLLRARAKARGWDTGTAAGFSASMLVGGLIFGHLAKMLYYRDAWAHITSNPTMLLLILSGQASFGGILGGLASGAAYLRWAGQRGPDLLKWFDLFASVFPFAWILGRMHCFVVHDHPGIRTQSWLGVRYPDAVRFDLAFLEILFLLLLIPALRLARPWLSRPGALCGAFLASYGAFRYFLDFLHVDAVRYLGWTVDTWASLTALTLGVLLSIPFSGAQRCSNPYGPSLQTRS